MFRSQVIYRHDPKSQHPWQAHLVDQGLSLPAATLAEAQQVARQRLPERFDEHVEHPLADGVYLRQAIDASAVDRGWVAGVLGTCLTDRRVLGTLHPLVEAAAKGVSAVACLPGDPVGWLLAQHLDGNVMVVGTAVSNTRAWWNVLLQQPPPSQDGLASLAALGLLDAAATVDSWMVKTPAGGTVTTGSNHAAMAA